MVAAGGLPGPAMPRAFDQLRRRKEAARSAGRDRSVVVAFSPLRVVLANAGDHPIGRRWKPPVEALVQIAEPFREVLIGAAAEMNIRSLAPHQPEQVRCQGEPL